MSSSNNGGVKNVPKDAQAIMSMLKDMGVNEYEPQVVHQLMEFTYRYVTGVLDDARAYATHASKKTIDIDDVQLAVQMQMDKSFTTPPPRDMLLSLARAKNSTLLQPVKPHCGIRLPPDRYCMSACNYELKSSKKQPASTAKPSSSGQAPMIKTQIKPAVKRTAQGGAKSQTVTVPKPVVKFTPTVQVIPEDSQWTSKAPIDPPMMKTMMDIDDPTTSLMTGKLDSA